MPTAIRTIGDLKPPRTQVVAGWHGTASWACFAFVVFRQCTDACYCDGIDDFCICDTRNLGGISAFGDRQEKCRADDKAMPVRSDHVRGVLQSWSRRATTLKVNLANFGCPCDRGCYGHSSIDHPGMGQAAS